MIAAIFAALWLITTGLFLIRSAGYDAALDQLRDAQRAHVDMAAELARVTSERDACLALANEYAPVPFELVDISEDVADLHATVYADEIAWGES